MGGSAPIKSQFDNATQGQQNLTQGANAQNLIDKSNLIGQIGSGQMSIGDAINYINNNAGQFSTSSNAGTQGAQDAANNLEQAQSKYGVGSPQYVDALTKFQQAGQQTGNPGSTTQQAISAMLSDPAIINQVGQYEAMQSPTLAGMFGQGGQLSQAEGNYTNASNNLSADRNALMGNDQSYGLQSQDLMAYNQAAGNIARQFGSQANSLSQQLANSGLAEGGSGSGAQAFSNIYGNQGEQLAGLQSQIALNRINTAQQLAQARTNADLSAQSNAQNYVGNLSSIGQNAQQNAVNNILNAKTNQANVNASQAGLGMQNQGMQQSIADTQYQQQQASNPGNMLAGVLTGGLGSLAGGAMGTLGSNLMGGTKVNYNISGGSGSAGGIRPI